MSPYLELVFRAGVLALIVVIFFTFVTASVIERKERMEAAKAMKAISERLASDTARLRGCHEAKNAEAPKRQLFPELFKKPEAK